MAVKYKENYMEDYKAMIIENMRKVNAHENWTQLHDFLPTSTVFGSETLIRCALNELISEQIVHIKLYYGVKIYKLVDRIV